MHFRYTKHQVVRGALADAVKDGDHYVIKNVRVLRATYQIRLLAYLAATQGKRVVLVVPAVCQLHGSLESLIEANPDLFVRRELK